MKNESLLLIVIAGILSHFVMVHFNLEQGISIHGVQFQMLPLIKIAGASSEKTTLTASVFGYLLFMIFFLRHIKAGKEFFRSLIYICIAITSIGIAIELSAYWQDWIGNYQGREASIGVVLLILAFTVLSKTKKIERLKNSFTENTA